MKTKPTIAQTLGSLEIKSVKMHQPQEFVTNQVLDCGVPVGKEHFIVLFPLEIEIETQIPVDFSNAGNLMINGTRFENLNPKRK